MRKTLGLCLLCVCICSAVVSFASERYVFAFAQQWCGVGFEHSRCKIWWKTWLLPQGFFAVWTGPQISTLPFGHQVLDFPVRTLAVLTGIGGIACLLVKKRSEVGACHNCGYSLRGNVSGVCPECGCAAMLGKGDMHDEAAT